VELDRTPAITSADVVALGLADPSQLLGTPYVAKEDISVGGRPVEERGWSVLGGSSRASLVNCCVPKPVAFVTSCLLTDVSQHAVQKYFKLAGAARLSVGVWSKGEGA
jgi:hypothetical protein